MRDRRIEASLRVLVVADANRRVGLGHLMRTRALVEALRERRRLRAAYLGRIGETAARLLRHWGYAVRRGTPGRIRAALGRVLGRARRPDVVVFDAYRRLERELHLAERSGAIVVLFDDQGRRGRAPVTIRVAPSQPRRGARSPRPAWRHLTGLRYLCLRPEIAALAGERKRPRGSRRRRRSILVSLGGGAAAGLGRLLRSLRGRVRADEWVVLSVSRSPRLGSGRIRRVSSPGGSARALAGAAAAVSAAGTTAWELACLGIPAALWARAPNQRPIARALDRRAALWCRREADLPRALGRLLEEPDLARRLSRQGMRLVDGKGAQRVARVILALLESSRRRAPSPRAVDSAHRSG